MDTAQHTRPTTPAAVAQTTPRVPRASLAWAGNDRIRSRNRTNFGRTTCNGPRSRTVDIIESPHAPDERPEVPTVGHRQPGVTPLSFRCERIANAVKIGVAATRETSGICSEVLNDAMRRT